MDRRIIYDKIVVQPRSAIITQVDAASAVPGRIAGDDVVSDGCIDVFAAFNTTTAFFIPVGDGNLISGMWKGFVDLYEIGFIDRLPQLISCQAESMDAINRAFESDGVIRPVKGETVADSISVSFPHDGHAALQAIMESRGLPYP